MDLNKQFHKAVSTSFYHLSVDDLKPIALGFWHEGYIPELSGLNQEELRKAGYLLDRFRGYNCVPKAQKRQLANVVQKVEQNLSKMIAKNVALVDNLEPLAKKWKLNEDISHLISPLLEYQTRHYVHQ